jgi:predicted lipid-binding transport protein (Tim44 family)
MPLDSFESQYGCSAQAGHERKRQMSDGLGGKFWLAFAGIIIGGGIAAMLLFTLIGAVWYAWGFLGTFLLIAVVALFAGWMYDRAHSRPYEDTAP